VIKTAINAPAQKSYGARTVGLYYVPSLENTVRYWGTSAWQKTRFASPATRDMSIVVRREKMKQIMLQRMRTDNNTICCAWCGQDLSHATQVRYLNGNLPVCDLCLFRKSAAISTGEPNG